MSTRDWSADDMLDSLWFQNSRKIAVLMPSLRCNITCAHCLLSCSPHSGESATVDQMQRWASEFIDLGFAPICLTGGEVFLYPDQVRAVSQICIERRTPLVIQTNGFWASTPAKAEKMLGKIPYIAQLGFSVDKAHMQFINPQTIENGIRAAYEHGISNVSLSISYQDLVEAEDIRRHFHKQFPKVTIDSWPITPIGRAKGNPELHCDYEEYAWDFLPRSCEAQNTFTPIVAPNGDVHLCYHLIMCLAQDDPFMIGNLREHSLKTILNNIRDPLFNFVIAYGGGSLGYLLSEIAPDLVSRKYQRTCQLCYEIFSQKELVSYLREILALPPFAERIEQTLTLRLQETDTAHSEEKEKIVACRGKNCFGKNTNVPLKSYFANRLVDSGKWEVARIECVNCMKACRYGPNVMLPGSTEIIHHVNSLKIDEIIQSL